MYTKERQELMVKNLNYLMRKHDVTNTVMQQVIYGSSDKNGKLVMKLRSGVKQFHDDEVLSISKYFHIQCNTFLRVDLDDLDQKGLLSDETLIVAPIDYDRLISYSIREVHGYNHPVGIIYIAIMFILGIGIGIDFLFPNISKTIFLFAVLCFSLITLPLALKGILGFKYEMRSFSLPESKEYYFYATRKKPKSAYIPLAISGAVVILTYFIYFSRVYDIKSVFFLLGMLYLIALYLIPMLIICVRKPKTLARIPYDLYYIDVLRRFSTTLVATLLCLFYYIEEGNPMYVSTFAVGMMILMILSEFMNMLVMKYYASFIGKEEGIF